MQRFVTFDIISEQNGKHRGIQTSNHTNISYKSGSTYKNFHILYIIWVITFLSLVLFFVCARMCNMLCGCLSFCYLTEIEGKKRRQENVSSICAKFVHQFFSSVPYFGVKVCTQRGVLVRFCQVRIRMFYY